MGTFEDIAGTLKENLEKLGNSFTPDQAGQDVDKEKDSLVDCDSKAHFRDMNATCAKGCGIAFSGGGFRAFAEVAVLEELEERGIGIAAVAGTSMGSLVAALCASGARVKTIQEQLVAMDKAIVEEGVLSKIGFKLFNLVSATGMIDSQILQDFSAEVLKNVDIRTFGDFKIPIAITAVDIKTSELVVFTNNASYFAAEDDDEWVVIEDLDQEVAPVVAASGSFPLVISTTEVSGRTFVDGGVRMNLPTALFERSQVDAVIGIGLKRIHEEPKELNAAIVAIRTFQAGMEQIDSTAASAADIYIHLPVSGDDAFQAGTGEQMIEEARTMLREMDLDWDEAKPEVAARVKRQATEAAAKFLRQSARRGQKSKTLR